MRDNQVSIIVPCFRQAHLLSTAIDSCLSQTYPAVQIVVVNDGSDDNVDEVVRRYEGRVTYVSKRNGGLPSARNAGIAVATGRYFLFLDADDALHPGAAAALVAAASEDDGRLCLMGFRCFSDRVADVGEEQLPLPGVAESELGRSILLRNPAPPNCYLVPATAVRAIGGFDESGKVYGCEDWDLWCRLILRGLRVTVVPFAGAYYRRYAGSMSTQEVRMTESRIEVRVRVLARVAAGEGRAALGMPPRKFARLLKRDLGAEAFDVGYLLQREGQFRRAATWHLRSLFSWAFRPRTMIAIAKLPVAFSFRKAVPTSPLTRVA